MKDLFYFIFFFKNDLVSFLGYIFFSSRLCIYSRVLAENDFVSEMKG